MLNDVKNLFESQQGQEQFIRVDNAHSLDIYIGRDQTYRSTLLILADNKPQTITSSQLIEVSTGTRKDNRWGISLSITDSHFLDLFYHLCNDIIQSSRIFTDNREGINFICERYSQWQEMLKLHSSKLLSKNEVKGVLGELMFLKNYLIPLYGEDMAIASWVGPEKQPQDFICKNNWYEIKSIASNAEKVTISSLEQLDSLLDGEFVTVYLDSTSASYTYKISLNQYYEELLQSLQSEKNKLAITDKLWKLTYFPHEEYNQYIFKFTKSARYKVTTSFPCLRRAEIPLGILSAKYDISLSSISSFLLEEAHQWT